MSRRRYTFEDSLLALQGDERPKRVVLQGLDDLSETDARRLQRDWEHLPVERRRWLVQTLGELADDQVELNFERVFRLGLADADEQVRAEAIEGLWEYQEDDLGEELLRLLQSDPAPTVRAAAASGLSQFTYLAELEELDESLAGRIRQALLDAFHSSQPLDVRRRVVEALGFLGESEDVRQIITTAYADREPSLRISALFAMGRTADSRWLGTLIGELQSEDAELRFEAARALGEIEDEAAVLALARAALDEDSEVRLSAIESLGSIGGEQATEALRELTRSKDEAVAEAAEEALSEATFFDSPLGMGLDSLGLDIREPGQEVETRGGVRVICYLLLVPVAVAVAIQVRTADDGAQAQAEAVGGGAHRRNGPPGLVQRALPEGQLGGQRGTPLHQGRAPGESGAETDQQDMVALLHPPLLHRLAERQRNRGARRVTVARQVRVDPLRRQFQRLGGRGDDARVGLVRDNQPPRRPARCPCARSARAKRAPWHPRRSGRPRDRSS